MINLDKEDKIFIKLFIAAIVILITTTVISNISYEFLCELGKFCNFIFSSFVTIVIFCIITEKILHIISKNSSKKVVEKILAIIGIIFCLIVPFFIEDIMSEDWLKVFGMVSIVILGFLITYIGWKTIDYKSKE